MIGDPGKVKSSLNNKCREIQTDINLFFQLLPPYGNNPISEAEFMW